jgi:TusA-related sulfurtransferase
MTDEDENVLDVRGDMCPGPALRVEQFLKANASKAPFSVIGDHRPTLESLELLAERFGWTLEFRQEGGDWRVFFTAQE